MKGKSFCCTSNTGDMLSLLMSDNPVVSVWIPHGVEQLLDEGVSLLNPSSFPAAVLSQFAGGDAH